MAGYAIKSPTPFVTSKKLARTPASEASKKMTQFFKTHDISCTIDPKTKEMSCTITPKV